jgi:hypothetical protein
MSNQKNFIASTAPVAETGTFSWTLESYKKLQLNETLQSPEFVVGGHMWYAFPSSFLLSHFSCRIQTISFHLFSLLGTFLHSFIV